MLHLMKGRGQEKVEGTEGKQGAERLRRCCSISIQTENTFILTVSKCLVFCSQQNLISGLWPVNIIVSAEINALPVSF